MAFAELQATIADEAARLIPAVMTLPQWVDVIIQLENFLKMEEGGLKAEDPISTLRDYLLGEPIAKVPEKVQ